MEYEAVPIQGLHSFRKSNIEQHRSVEGFFIILRDYKDSVVDVLPHEKWVDVVDKYPEMRLPVAKRNDDCNFVFWIAVVWEELSAYIHFF